jgi:type VI secretion system secreted protein VgrG
MPAIDTSVFISITLGNGKEVTPFNSLTITQSIVQHHSFEVRCYHSVFEDPKANIISATQNMVGQDITIKMKAGKDGKENIFKGIITEVGMVQGDGMHHEIILKGYSSSIKLENGPRLKSFLEKSIGDIASEIISASGLRKKGDVKYTSPHKYCAQFNESDFEFLRRLAAIHGEWFYYDGINMVFGEPGSLSTVKLQYMQDLMTLSMGMGTVPLQFKDYSYNSEEAKTFEGQLPGSIDGSDNYGQKMHTASKNLFPDKFKLMPRHVTNDQGGLDNFSKSYFNAIGSGLVNVQASGDNPEIAIGVLADISTQDGSSYGKFFVTSITHHADGMGHYTNNFTGIPSTLKTLPNPYIHKPNADFEIAKVMDNNDPDKHGKVKVKFMWMEDSDQTAWIPTTQLYGGEGGFKNRGMIFIPEIGDDVIVGFERGDCDRPYVSHSLMNGKAIETDDRDNAKNLKKIISTRDNNITFHDKGDSTPVGMGLRVYSGDSDPKVAIYMTDESGVAKLKMGAIDELYIATIGDEVVLHMKKDGSIKVTGKNVTFEVDEKFAVKAKDIQLEATNNFNAKANSNVKIEAMSNLDIKASANLTAKAGANATVQGTAQTDVKGTMVNVKADAMLDLEGGGMTTLKGGVVMIN